MGHRSQRSEAGNAGDWTELERGFFAAAPPEVAVQPPPPPSFDDLVAAEPPRARRRKVARAVSRDERLRREGARLLRRIAAAAGPAGARVWRWTEARARLGARRLVAAARGAAPSLRGGLARLERAVRALPARLAVDLPERPDGKTIVAALAALLIVSGVSARVLGSHAIAHRAHVPAAAPTALVEAAAPSVAAPVPAPEAAPVLPAPAPPAVAPSPPKAHAVAAKRHHGKARAGRTVAPSSASRANVFAR